MDIGALETNSVISNGSAIAAAHIPKIGSGQLGRAVFDNAEVNDEKIRQMVETMQDQINSMDVSLQYSTYGEHGEKIAVAVVNKDTGDVIREIPPKELQNLYARMSELAGMIFNKQI